MQKISITEPCSENWNTMQTQSDGRWCLSCSKTVVDFTKMSNAEMLDYIKNENAEKICGRCRTDQVILPTKKSNRFRWLASIVSFFFGMSLLSSCYRHVHGCMAYVPDQSQDKKHKQEIKSDSVHSNHFEK